MGRWHLTSGQDLACSSLSFQHRSSRESHLEVPWDFPRRVDHLDLVYFGSNVSQERNFD